MKVACVKEKSMKVETDNKEKLLSVVIPVFNEEDNIFEVYTALSRVLSSIRYTVEIVFVDDGSRDKTWNKINQLHQTDSLVKGIRFSKNYGHQYALYAGLNYARGDIVVSMDGDLQHPPEVIPQLIDEWEKGNMVVNTMRKDEQGVSLFKKWTSKVFYKLFSFLSGVNLESGMADFRLLDKRVVEDLSMFRERKLFLRGMIQIIGYPTTQIKYLCQARHTGSSKYTLCKMLKLAWTGISSFSMVPLRISIVIGLITSAFAFAELFYVVYARLFTHTTVSGWASSVSITAFLFGVLFILLGITGEYIGHILIEVRDRPRFLVQERIGL